MNTDDPKKVFESDECCRTAFKKGISVRNGRKTGWKKSGLKEDTYALS